MDLAEQLKQLVQKIPFGLMILGVIAMLGWDYYSFMNHADSELGQAKSQLEAARAQTQKLKKKVAEAREFYGTLQTKREVLRALASELNSMKVTLTEQVDSAEFLKTLVTEAQKVGLTVMGVKPEGEVPHELYMEKQFRLKVKGLYVQLVVFLERIAKVKKITRIDEYAIQAGNAGTQKYVELTGDFLVSVYYYTGSQADQIADSLEEVSPAPNGSENGANPAGKKQKAAAGS